MKRELKRARLMHGRALIRSYYDDWLPEKKRIDRFLENVVSSSPYLKEDPIQGGEKIPPQERLLRLKEENKEYCELEKNIEKMKKILDGLTEEQKETLSLYYEQGLTMQEISQSIPLSMSTVSRRISSIDGVVISHWVK
jgi:RNA polymerase sigma factor (sigma-70 family)